MPDFDLNCQGLPCPQPVLRCKECIDKDRPEGLRVTVDNAAARDNVSRFLVSQGYGVAVDEVAGGWLVTGMRGGDAACECEVMSHEAIAKIAGGAVNSGIVAFITAETVGKGDDELGAKLMFNFLATLPELGSDLWRIVLVNGGVKLACEGSPCLEKLQALAARGVSILVCGTCLDFFGLLEKKRVGETTNMLDVVTSLQIASKVVQV